MLLRRPRGSLSETAALRPDDQPHGRHLDSARLRLAARDTAASPKIGHISTDTTLNWPSFRPAPPGHLASFSTGRTVPFSTAPCLALVRADDRFRFGAGLPLAIALVRQRTAPILVRWHRKRSGSYRACWNDSERKKKELRVQRPPKRLYRVWRPASTLSPRAQRSTGAFVCLSHLAHAARSLAGRPASRAGKATRAAPSCGQHPHAAVWSNGSRA